MMPKFIVCAVVGVGVAEAAYVCMLSSSTLKPNQGDITCEQGACSDTLCCDPGGCMLWAMGDGAMEVYGPDCTGNKTVDYTLSGSDKDTCCVPVPPTPPTPPPTPVPPPTPTPPPTKSTPAPDTTCAVFVMPTMPGDTSSSDVSRQ